MPKIPGPTCLLIDLTYYQRQTEGNIRPAYDSTTYDLLPCVNDFLLVGVGVSGDMVYSTCRVLYRVLHTWMGLSLYILLSLLQGRLLLLLEMFLIAYVQSRASHPPLRRLCYDSDCPSAYDRLISENFGHHPLRLLPTEYTVYCKSLGM